MEIDYNKAFGLEEESAEAQPAGENTVAGNRQDAVQTAAEPGTSAGAETGNGAAAETGAEASAAQEGDKAPQIDAERSRQAEYRRRREERENRIRAQARAEVIDEVNRTLRGIGMPDPDTGEAVDSVEKLNAYYKALSDARLAEGNGTVEDIRRIAREEMDAQQQTQENAPAGRTAGEPAAPSNAQEELAEIARMDPDMKSLKDILTSEAGPKFREYVHRGLNFVEAYKLAAENRLNNLRNVRTQEAATVKAASKDHLNSTQSRGQGAEPIPADEMAMYRVFFPGATDAEIREYAAEDKRQLGK